MIHEKIREKDNLNNNIRDYISNIAKTMRQASIEQSRKYKGSDLNKPVTSWIKEDRLIKEVGYEFTIIFRTCACEWANSDSGGCSMCGYFNDKGPLTTSQDEIFRQFEYALQKHEKTISEISEKNKHISIKLFTSGSFLDDREITSETRAKIFQIISEFSCISEVIIESRPEYFDPTKITPLVKLLGNKILEIGTGIESSNKFVRECLINKGFSFPQIKKAIDIAHSAGARVKAYLLLKPPFLSEKIAIKDAILSIKDALDAGVDTISLNPVNIQKFTVAERLFFKNQYRTPWIYSVISVLQQSLNPEILKNVLVVCDPSAAGKERGVHNCRSRDCNEKWLQILKQFVFTQDYSLLDPQKLPYFECNCWGEYNIFLEVDNR